MKKQLALLYKVDTASSAVPVTMVQIAILNAQLVVSTSTSPTGTAALAEVHHAFTPHYVHVYNVTITTEVHA